MEFRKEYHRIISSTPESCGVNREKDLKGVHFFLSKPKCFCDIHCEIPLFYSEIPLFHYEIPLSDSTITVSSDTDDVGSATTMSSDNDVGSTSTMSSVYHVDSTPDDDAELEVLDSSGAARRLLGRIEAILSAGEDPCASARCIWYQAVTESGEHMSRHYRPVRRNLTVRMWLSVVDLVQEPGGGCAHPWFMKFHLSVLNRECPPRRARKHNTRPCGMATDVPGVATETNLYKVCKPTPPTDRPHSSICVHHKQSICRSGRCKRHIVLLQHATGCGG